MTPRTEQHAHRPHAGATRRKARRVLGLAVAAAGLCWIPSCYSATEITISIDTDVPCDVVRSRGVAVFVSDAPESLHDTGPVATTSDCTDRPEGAHVGTLTFVPSGERDDRIAIEVVVGVDRPTDDCIPDPQGCIVARRAPRFIAHSSLRLPIRLSARCKGASCGATDTCNEDTGQCVSIEGCGEKGCNVVVADAGRDAALVDVPVVLDAACAPGFADCDGNATNGCETLLATSSEHCGGCGQSCGGATCAGATCGAAVVMQSIAMPSAIAVSGDDVFVTSELPGVGTLVTCKTAGCGVPVVLASGMNNPNAVAVDDTRIFFSSSDKFLRRCERPACAAPVMFGNDSFSTITMNGATVYAASEFNAYAARITKADAVSSLLSSSNPLGIAVDATDAYMPVATGIATATLRCPLTGCTPFGPPPQLTLTTASLQGIAVDDTNVYWTETDTGRVMRTSKDLTSKMVAITTTAKRPVDVAVAGDFVYWVEEGTTDDDGVLNSDAKVGGAPLVLARGQHRPRHLVVSGGRVYWTNRVAAGSVLSIRAR